MASLRQIRQRMKAIKNIHGITKAMGMIATFRFKRSENRFSRSRSYFQELEKLVANLAATVDGNLSRGDSLSRPYMKLFEPRSIKRKALVVMTGDKGLCGAYNSNLIRAAQTWLTENKAFSPVLIPVAKVGFEFFRRKHLPTALGYPEKAMVNLELGKKVTTELKELFISGKTDSVEILYAAYRPGTPGRNALIPFLSLAYLAEAAKTAKGSSDFIYEPDFDGVFSEVLERYLEGKVYMTLLESLTSESSARMLAMKQATDNAEDVLDNLKLLRNKTRQATITRELSEIVGGASVLV